MSFPRAHASVIRRTIRLLAAVAVLTTAAPASAQYCQDWVRNLGDVTDCSATPSYDKYFIPMTFSRSGRDYMTINTGNELTLYDITNPAAPVSVSESRFFIPNDGDSDYDLVHYSVCDGCQYGIAAFKLDTVLFDLGTGSVPDLTTDRAYGDSSSSGLTFAYNGVQYVLNSSLGLGCAEGGSPLIRMDGIQPNDLTLMSCAKDADGDPIAVMAGAQLTGTRYLYAGTSDGIHVFELVTSPGTRLVDRGKIANGFGTNKSIDVDSASRYMATVAGFQVTVWDLSSPANPTPIGSYTAPQVLTTVAIRYPFVFAARRLDAETELLFLIDDFVAGNPVPIDPGFWVTPNARNPAFDCEKVLGATFSPDGSHLYTGAWTVFKQFDITACSGPTAPIASVSLDQPSYFPGEEVRVTDTSVGQIDRSSIWVTDSSSYAGNIVAGDDVLTATDPAQLTYTIPANIGVSAVRYAHVAAENDSFAYVPTNPQGQRASTQIVIDRAPTASIAIDPSAPITGDSVDLTGVVPIEPPGGDAAYQWQISRDGGTRVPHTGKVVPNVTLSPSGEYLFELTVNYNHGAPPATDPDSDGLYEAVASRTVNVTSVAADFSFPSSPLNTEPITLDGSLSNWTTGADVSFDWSVTGATSYNGCADNVTCTIPADTLNPGQHTVTLTLTNNSNDDVSDPVSKTMNVVDGSINLDFEFNRLAVARGEAVRLTITGVPGSVDRAIWSFEGTGCPGYPTTMTCDLDLLPLPTCSTWEYKWSTSGTKTVTLESIVVGGNTIPAGISHDIQVLNSGSCDGTPSPTPTPRPTPPPSTVQCNYTLSSYSNTVPFTGGEYTVGILANGSPTFTNCSNSWQAYSENGNWLVRLSGSSGTGASIVRYSVLENPLGTSRNGRLSIAGNTFNVTQGAYVNTNFEVSNPQPNRGERITFTVNPALQPVSWNLGSPDCDGAPQTIDCTLLPAEVCRNLEWAYPESGLYEVVFTSTTGSRSKTVWVQNDGECPPECHATASPPAEFWVNPSPARAGEAVTFAYGEGGIPACNVTLSPTSGSFNADGGSFSFQIAAAGDCDWTATGSTSWITITSPTSGRGPAQVSYTVAANSGQARNGAISVNGAIHSVSQAARVDCAYSLDPMEAHFEADGGAGSVTVDTAAGCAWTAASDRDWITITSGASGDGPGMVQYTVAANSEDERFGDITIGGQTHSVSQDAGQDMETPEEKVLAVDFTWSPSSPEIAEEVRFNLTGVTGAVHAEWSFGGAGCGGEPSSLICDPFGPFDCHYIQHAYATSGQKTVSVTVKNPTTGATIGSASHSITVQSTGSCGGTPTCSYSISPSSGDLPAAGGVGTVTVSTGGTCPWSATTTSSWITIVNGTSRLGPGTFSYQVSANTGPARTGGINVENRTHTVRQEEADQGETNRDPEWWRWTIRRGTEVIATSDAESFEHVFAGPGTYRIELRAGNCVGSNTSAQTLEVLERQIEDFVVPAAVHTPGLNDTMWLTDLRMFNPCEDPVRVTVDYLPEATNNSTVTHWRDYTIAPNETLIVDDVISYFPTVEGDSNKGSMRFHYEGNGCMPVVMSRTYNHTEQGTFGQAVEAEPVGPVGDDYLYLTGLVHNVFYRTNVGIANFGDDDVWTTITLLDEFGDQLGDPITVMVNGNSTRQIVEVAEKANVTTDVPIFSAVIDTNGHSLSANASVVDEVTGDPVLYRSYRTLDSNVWIPGVAHLPGKNNSIWYSDITFLNPYDNVIKADVAYIPDDNPEDTAGMTLTIDSGDALYYVDVLGVSVVPELSESKGYFVVTSTDGSPLPQIAAKTYNLAPEGGTFGQNLKVFKSSDLIAAGQVGYIPGVRHTSSRHGGFRTNFGLLNTGSEGVARVDVTIFGVNGSVAGERTVWLDPGQFKQIDLFNLTDLTDAVTEGSVEFRVESGGPIAVYASEVDNRTQDPVLIPAVIGIGVK